MLSMCEPEPAGGLIHQRPNRLRSGGEACTGVSGPLGGADGATAVID